MYLKTIAWRPMTAIFVTILLAWLCLVPAHASQPERPKVYLHLSCAQNCVSGSRLQMRLELINHSSLPLELCSNGHGQAVPAQFYLQLADASHGPGGKILLSASGRRDLNRVYFPLSRTLASTPLIPAGGNMTWPQGYSLMKYYDMTMPGRYRLAIATRQGLYLVRRKIWRKGKSISIGRHFYLPIQEDFILHKKMAKAKRIETTVVSNFVLLSVDAPYKRLPLAALLLPTIPAAKYATAMKRGVHIELVKPVISGTGRVTLCVQFLNDGQRSAKVHLTGNPSADFSAIQVTGPSFPGESITVQKPKPHEVPYIRKNPATLTAYGKWLSKHPIKNLKRKTYVLKPGVVYKYAEPINLSCMYDMSLSGVYRVRVRLKDSNIWSPWTNITVPQD